MIALLLQAFVAFLAGGAILTEIWSSVFPKRTVDNEDQPLPTGFFRTAYRAWKEKYCPLVTMKKDDD